MRARAQFILDSLFFCSLFVSLLSIEELQQQKCLLHIQRWVNKKRTGRKKKPIACSSIDCAIENRDRIGIG